MDFIFVILEVKIWWWYAL